MTLPSTNSRQSDAASSTKGSSVPGRSARRGTGLPRPAAFVAIAVVFVALFAAAAAPSPLLVVYQAQWGFPEWLLTFAFAIYAVALLVALLVFGSLSDHIGRRPVLIGALVVQIAAMTVFLFSGDIEMVILARILQGIATGAATGAISALLTDLAPDDNKRLGATIGSLTPMGGLGLGALVAGLLIQVSAGASTEIFVALDVVFALGIIVTLLVNEPIGPRPGALRSLVPRVRVPRAARAAFGAATPGVVAAWMTSGFYLGLVAAILGGVFGLHSGLLNGAAVALLAGSGAVAVGVFRHVSATTTSLVGNALLIVGMVATVLSLFTGSIVLFGIGAVLGGFGLGATFSGAVASILPNAAPHERGELFAAIYVVSYLAFGLPAIVAGLFVASAGLFTVAIVYAIVVVAVAAAALGAQFVRRGGATSR